MKRLLIITLMLVLVSSVGADDNFTITAPGFKIERVKEAQQTVIISDTSIDRNETVTDFNLGSTITLECAELKFMNGWDLCAGMDNYMECYRCEHGKWVLKRSGNGLCDGAKP